MLFTRLCFTLTCKAVMGCAPWCKGELLCKDVIFYPSVRQQVWQV